VVLNSSIAFNLTLKDIKGYYEHACFFFLIFVVVKEILMILKL